MTKRWRSVNSQAWPIYLVLGILWQGLFWGVIFEFTTWMGWTTMGPR